MLHTTNLRKFLLIIFLALLGTSQASTVSAEPNVWKSIGPEGGYIISLAIDPATPATLYAGTNGGGIFSLKQMVLLYLPLILRQ